MEPNIKFTDEDEKDYFMEDVMTDALLEEIKRRQILQRRVVKTSDINYHNSLRAFTFDVFFGSQIKNKFINIMFDYLKREYNLQLFVNKANGTFSYLFDVKDSNLTLAIFGAWFEFE